MENTDEMSEIINLPTPEINTDPIPEIKMCFIRLKRAESDCTAARVLYDKQWWPTLIDVVEDAIGYLAETRDIVKAHMEEIKGEH